MKFWTGVTDNKWFNFLSGRAPVEVNFWQPSAIAPFTSLPPGTPFLFKLKSPNNHIAGGGYFVKFVRLPLHLAWDAFVENNGAASLAELQHLIGSSAGRPVSPTHEIGCTVLTDPFFLPREQWIPMDNWSSGIMRGKIYDTTNADGMRIWQAVQDRLSLRPAALAMRVAERPAQYGEPFLTQARLGQGTFRVLVTEAYERRCAITGESTLPVLEAAHIKPFAQEGPNNTYNGLLLRSDFHKLFDLGLVTVTPDFHVEVSPKIREEWFNGKAYYRLHGQKMAILPANPAERPNPEFLAWHNENRFAG